MKYHDGFCTCSNSSSVTTGFEDDFGYWDVCCDCGRKIIDGTIIQNTYFKNMRFKDFGVEKCMSNTIKEISQIDPSINSNTFFHTI